MSHWSHSGARCRAVAWRCVAYRFLGVRRVSVSMAVSRKRPKGVRYYAPLGLSVLAMGLMPRSIGYQDLVALMAQQTEVPQRVRAHMLASPFGTIHAATFSFPQPVGTQFPNRRWSSSPASAPTIPKSPARWGAIRRSCAAIRPRVAFPTVNRRLKGDLLVSRPHDGKAARRHPRLDAGTGQDRVVSEVGRKPPIRNAPRPSRRTPMPPRSQPSAAAPKLRMQSPPT